MGRVFDSQKRRKKCRMDPGLASNCEVILQKLMKHRHAYAFNQPVAPVRLGVSDYFGIVKCPMDLGTVKKRLDHDFYVDAVEFESDVRLTFSNAMLYNPPHNVIHHNAKELLALFDHLWKPSKTTHVMSKKCSLDKNNRKLPIRKRVSADLVNKPSAVKPLKVKDMMGESEKKCSSADDKISFSAAHNLIIPTREHDLKRVSCDQLNMKPSVGKQNSVCESQPRISEVGSEGRYLSCLSEEEEAGCTNRGIETSTSETQVSPSKALRVAKLKSRFAETIFKAQQTLMHQPGSTVTDDHQLIKFQREKARVVAEAELEVKRQRQKDREAARRALEEVEQSVDIEDNFKVMREFEALIGYPTGLSPLWIAELEVKMQRQKERVAARMELEKLEQSVNVEDNFLVLREIEALVGYSVAFAPLW